MPSNGAPGFVPSSEKSIINRWLRDFFSSDPVFSFQTLWLGRYTESWSPWWHGLSDNLPAVQELIYYMFVIEQTYKYYDIIESAPLDRQNPPLLELPETLSVSNNEIKEIYARRLFIAQLANSFVLEKNKVLPWSLLSYSRNLDLSEIVNSGTDELPVLPLIRSDFCYYYSVDRLSSNERARREVKDNPKVYPGRYSSLADRKISINYSVTPIIPSNPIEIFLWMKDQGFLSNINSINSANEAREIVRDNIISWTIEHQAHGLFFAHSKENPWRRRLSNGTFRYGNYSDYFEMLYGGNGESVPAVKFYSGHVIDRLNYQRYNSSESKKEYEPVVDVFSPMAQSMSSTSKDPKYAKQVFQYRAPRGCWSTTWALHFALRTVNIPSYYTGGTIYYTPRGYHASLVLPAEPDPKNPEQWIMVHGDDPYSAVVSPPNPYKRVPIPKMLWTLREFREDMTSWKKIKGSTKNKINSILKYCPSPWWRYTIGSFLTDEELDLYGRRNDYIHNWKRFKFLMDNYPPIRVVIAALYLSDYFGRNIMVNNKGIRYMKGPVSNWIYTERNLLSTLGVNNLIRYYQAKKRGDYGSMFQEKRNLQMQAMRDSSYLLGIKSIELSESKDLDDLLILAKVDTGSENKQINSFQYFRKYDEILKRRNVPPETNSLLYYQILNVNFNKKVKS